MSEVGFTFGELRFASDWILDFGFTFGELRFASYLFDLIDLPPNELINYLLI
jgi:hypothetical protein